MTNKPQTTHPATIAGQIAKRLIERFSIGRWTDELAPKGGFFHSAEPDDIACTIETVLTSAQPTDFMRKYGISIQDMIDWLEVELSGIEHARAGGCPIDPTAQANENMMLAIQDVLEAQI